MFSRYAKATSEDFAERQKYKIVKFIAEHDTGTGANVHAGNFKRDEGENLPPTAPFLACEAYDKHIVDLRDNGYIEAADDESVRVLHNQNCNFEPMRLCLTKKGKEYKEDYESRGLH